MRKCNTILKHQFSLQMVVSPTHASLAQSAPAPPMALSDVADVHQATPGMASHAKTLMSVKKFLMLATHTTEFIAVRTLSQVTTACPARHVSPVLSPLEEEWSRRLPKNRFELLLTAHACGLKASLHFFNALTFLFRFAHPVTLARMVATTAIKMQTVSTWASTPNPCSDVSASQGMLGMAIFAEKTLTWMDGPILTCCVWRMLPTTAKR